MTAAGRQVFVYGSLLSAASLQRTLPGASPADTASPFVLPGWSRAWNVVSTRTFPVADAPDGPLHRRLVLGIQPDPVGRCAGAILDLNAADLAALTGREAAYDLQPVATDARGHLVWAYLPRPERTRGASRWPEPLVVEQAYLDECRAGIADLGLIEAEAELDASLAGLRIARAAS